MSIPGKPATHENGRGGFGASRFPPISPLRPEGMNKSTSAYEAGSSYEGDCTIGFWGDKELGKSASALDLDDWSICERQTSKLYESDDNKFGFWEASAVNTLNMLGKGPFITVPYLLASTVPSGPQVQSRRR